MEKPKKKCPEIHRISDDCIIYLTARGLPLVWTRRPTKKPVLTIENSTKWYELYVIYSDDSDAMVAEMDFGELDTICHANEIAYMENAPNPAMIRRLAQLNDWDIDENAYEMIIGRWEQEVGENYLSDEDETANNTQVTAIDTGD